MSEDPISGLSLDPTAPTHLLVATERCIEVFGLCSTKGQRSMAPAELTERRGGPVFSIQVHEDLVGLWQPYSANSEAARDQKDAPSGTAPSHRPRPTCLA